MDLRTWIGLGVVAVAVLFFALVYVAMPALIVVTAVWDKARVLNLTRTDQQPEHLGAAKIVADAAAIGYQHIGVFRHEASLGMKWIMSLMLSPDRLVAIQIVH